MMEELTNRREFLTKAIVGGTVGVGTVGAVATNRIRTLPADVEIVRKADHAKIQRVSTLDVAVTNHGSKPLRPYFSTLREGLSTRFYWNVDSDPRTVEPGSTVTFRLLATNPGMAVPYREDFLLAIEDRGANRGAFVSGNAGRPEGLIPIRNPSFEQWLAPLTRGTVLPFRWSRIVEQREDDRVDISQVERGAKLRATRNRRGEPWTMAGLVQRVPALESLQISAVPGALVPPGSFKDGPVCGLELVDREYRVWTVYADTDQRTSELYSRGSREYHVEYVPATRGRETTATLNLARIYDERGWSQPPGRSLSIEGIEYPASTTLLHPFAAVFSGDGNAEMTLASLSPGQ